MMDSRTQRLVALSVATLAIGCARARTEDVGLADSTTASTTVTSDSTVASRTTTTDTLTSDTTVTRDTTVMRDTTTVRTDTAVTRDTAMTRDTTTGDTTRVSATGDVSLGVGTATDAQVAQLIATVDRAEIEEARLVLSKTQNSELRSYAQRLVDEHTASLATVDSANATSGASASDTSNSASRTTVMTDSTRRDTSHAMHQTNPSMQGTQDVGSAIATLKAAHDRKMAELNGQSGEAFDRAYIQGQVEGHQTVLSLLRRFGSNVNTGTLRTHVSGYTDKVSQHLEQARTLQRSISG